MATLTGAEIATIADLLKSLGDIPPSRVRINPSPGTATEDDVLDVKRRQNRLCELVDGVLVEKAMGYCESLLAVAISVLIDAFVTPRNLGLLSGEAGMMRLFPGLVRIPDVAFVSWDRVPGRCVPAEPIAGFSPCLAVEILSRGNTAAEMDQKRLEYFSSGVRLLCLIDPVVRRVTVFTGPDEMNLLKGQDDVLDGGAVLPGFQVALGEIFKVLDRQG